MEKIRKILIGAGYTEKETEVYLACLQLGKATVYQIAQKSGLKRTTVYTTLDSLVEKGLVDSFQTKKSITYHPLNPKKIVTQLKNKKESVEQILPELNALFHDKDRPSKPDIKIYEGVSGYDEIAKDIIAHLDAGEEMLFWGDNKFFINTQGSMAKRWIKNVNDKKYKIREIIYGNSPEQNDYIKEIKLQNKYYKIKQFPDTNTVQNDNAIYGNKFVIFSTDSEEIYTTVIENETVVETYKTIFNQLWSINI